eukprot:NODE_721_length_1953_cov_80.375000_g663_i1.p1 GENE.NODE_721_length_1953_cov_80.375000_g663_i1~~NODE_721_length_1953_cov_80.375000_g663_i1.p1  ORF type:complete len:356 (-),score=52.14 NODE_721_length_1953_cov_80.375000_g663_i1:806-1873(-)
MIDSFCVSPTSSPPSWRHDRAAADCQGCQAEFTWMLRRHHCRACGEVFCNSCSRYRLALPEYALCAPQRVCGSCMKNLMSKSHRMTRESIMLSQPVNCNDGAPAEVSSFADTAIISNSSILDVRSLPVARFRVTCSHPSFRLVRRERYLQLMCDGIAECLLDLTPRKVFLWSQVKRASLLGLDMIRIECHAVNLLYTSQEAVALEVEIGKRLNFLRACTRLKSTMDDAAKCAAVDHVDDVNDNDAPSAGDCLRRASLREAMEEKLVNRFREQAIPLPDLQAISHYPQLEGLLTHIFHDHRSREGMLIAGFLGRFSQLSRTLPPKKVISESLPIAFESKPSRYLQASMELGLTAST